MLRLVGLLTYVLGLEDGFNVVMITCWKVLNEEHVQKSIGGAECRTPPRNFNVMGGSCFNFNG